ncbi:MAG: Hsp20/alpha crystallin family protein [Bacteroidia bacterium]|nr:Hsp20/alpha crystallin family protein [Bacteroidia bacterium]
MSLIKSNQKEELFPSLLSDFFDNNRFFGNPWFEREFTNSLPAVNIKEDAKQFDIEFAAPGFNKNDFKINVENNVMTVSAEKKNETNEENKRFTRKEFNYSSFSRSFTLPQSVNSDKIDAKYTDGVLHLQVPKKEPLKESPTKEIKVQ